MAGKLGRNVKLVAQLAHEGDPQGDNRCIAHDNVFALAEPEVLVADIVTGHSLQQLAGFGSDDVDDRVGRGNILETPPIRHRAYGF